MTDWRFLLPDPEAFSNPEAGLETTRIAESCRLEKFKGTDWRITELRFPDWRGS